MERKGREREKPEEKKKKGERRDNVGMSRLNTPGRWFELRSLDFVLIRTLVPFSKREESRNLRLRLLNLSISVSLTRHFFVCSFLATFREVTTRQTMLPS